MDSQMLEKVTTGNGFIAALDQSGGSSPKALKLYGVEESQFSSEEQMFDLIHQMRTRIVTSPAFSGEKILGAILFEQTMDRQIDGEDSPSYLWNKKSVVPFLKVDKGLAEEANGVQIMNPMPQLGSLLQRASEKAVFGTKMRSVIKVANNGGIKAVVEQQFEVGQQILDAGLVPIIEPEVDIHSSEKAKAEELLAEAIAEQLSQISQPIMLKLTLPEQTNFYSDFVESDKVARVVALSGGYSRQEANQRLSDNTGVIASFSRALTEGLSTKQSDEEFNAMLESSIETIFNASIT